jgi:hypothetical protein
MMRRGLLLAATLALVGGCTMSWPPAGRGGMAETHPPPVAHADGEEAAYATLKSLTDQLAALRQQGAGARYPGRVARVEELVVRIRRGLAGGLVQDAQVDLGRLRGELTALSDRLRQAAPSSEKQA